MCSCPYGENFGDPSKHIAAVVLEFHHNPGNVIHEASVINLLAPLGADTLRGALTALLRRYPEALDGLELYLQKECLEHGDAQAEKTDPTQAEAAWVESGQTKTAQAEVPSTKATLDTRLFEKMMRSAVKGTSWDWDGFPEYREVYTVVEEIDPFLARGAYRDALALTEALVNALIDAINSLENAYNSAQRRAAEIMDAGRLGAYDEVAAWLRYARDAYSSSGQNEAWRTYLAGVREKHLRKYKLMAALEVL